MVQEISLYNNVELISDQTVSSQRGLPESAAPVCTRQFQYLKQEGHDGPWSLTGAKKES